MIIIKKKELQVAVFQGPSDIYNELIMIYPQEKIM